MENVKMSVKGTTLTIEVDLSKRGKRTEKTIRIASTCGNVPVMGTDSGAIIGLNIYTKEGM
jgi:hypothetical protein